MGGVEPARTYIVQAGSRKQVVTANKDVLAEHGQEILSLAENSGAISSLRRQSQARSRSSVP